MEIAINKIILFLIVILPGIIFLRFYYTGEFTKQFSKRPLSETFYLSIIPGVIIQAITAYTFKGLYDNAKVQNYLELINNLLNNDFELSVINSEIILFTGMYFSLLGIYAILTATITHWIIRYFNIDKTSPVLRFDNTWHYYFSGEITKFKDFKGIISKSHKVLMTEADVLIESNGKSQLYKGFIRQHTICKDTGRLEEIYMTDSRRYNDEKLKFTKIPGNIFILPYDKILNINLTFLTTPIERKVKQVSIALINIIVLILLILLIIDVFGLFKNLSIWSHIIVRLIAFFDWAIFVTLIGLLTTTSTTKSPNKTSTTIYLFAFLAIFTFLIFYIIKQ